MVHHVSAGTSAWLNMVERWFGLLTERQLRRAVHVSVEQLEAAIHHYIDITNENPKPFVWTKTAEQILAKLVH